MSAIHYVYENDWYQDLYKDTSGLIRYSASLFQNGHISDIYNENSNLLADIENLEWYAKRLINIAENLDHYHLNLTDEQEARNKVDSLFENKF